MQAKNWKKVEQERSQERKQQTSVYLITINQINED